MPRPRLSTVLALLVFGGVGLAIVLEWARPRPAPAPAVVSRPPLRADETDRLDGGFTWSGTSGGKVLFQLLASTLLGTEGGVHLLRDVKDLKFYLEDGRPVLVSARGGRLQQKDDAGRDVEISLDGDVRVRDPDGLVFETQSLIYNTVSRRVRTGGPAEVKGPDFIARAGLVNYEPDQRVLRGSGQVMVRYLGPDPWQVDSPQGLFLVRQNEVHFEQPFLLRLPGRALLAGPGTIWLSSPGRPGRFDFQGPVLLGGEGEGVFWQLAARELRTRGPETPGSPGSRWEAEGPATLVAGRADPAGEERWVLNTQRWVVEPAPARKHRAVAAPGFQGSWRPAGQSASWEFGGQRLEVLQDPRAGVEQVRARGAVQLRGPENITAEAETLVWEKREAGVIVLAGSPATTRQRGDTLEAPEIRLLRDQDRLIGTGGTVTQLASLGGSPGENLLGGEEPVRVRSQGATLDRQRGKAEFTGPVQAWQGQAHLKANRLSYDDRARVLLAEGEVRLRRDEPGRGGGVRTVRLACDRLEHRGAERLVLVGGRSVYSTPDGQVEADRMQILIGREGGVERLEAEGNVRLDAPVGEGQGDRLVWEGGEEGSALLTGDRRLVELRKRPGGDVTRAKSLRYYPADGRIVGDGGSGRTTIEGTPPAEKPVKKDPA